MSKPKALAGLIALEALFFLALALVFDSPLALVLLWASLACALVSLAYVLNWPGVYGKRSGRLRGFRPIAVFPYLAVFWGMCALLRWWRPTRALDEVAPGIYVGGRLRGRDLPPGTVRIIDLTCEFGEPDEIYGHPGYRFFPVLDGGVPDDEAAFEGVLDDVRAAAGPVVFHCDAGRGRAPTAAALGLLWRGIENDCEAACRRVMAGRQATSYSASDRAFIARMFTRLSLTR